VRDLVDDHVESEGVQDIFKLAGIPTPDISILNDQFLQTFKDRPHEDLRLKLLKKLLEDALQRHAQRNPTQTRSFRKLLEETMRRYHQRLIDAAAVVSVMADIGQETQKTEDRAAVLGLSEEELAFYDAIHNNYAAVYEEPFLRELVHEVVQVVKSNLKVDWTEDHRENVRSTVKTAVKRVLTRKKVKPEDFDGLINAVLAHAAIVWKDWGKAA
jgi:type I restriction enzyme, R subunit